MFSKNCQSLAAEREHSFIETCRVFLSKLMRKNTNAKLIKEQIVASVHFTVTLLDELYQLKIESQHQHPTGR